MKLDYSLKTPEERIECVNKVLAATPSQELTPKYLSYMSDYILFVSDKNQTKKEKKNPDGGILTRNREITINKRETSYEGLASSLENGEDGIHALITNDKNQIMDRRDPISKKDLEVIPHLQEYYNNIERLKTKLKSARGHDRYVIKQQIIETWQSMYMMKASYYAISMKKRPTNYIKMVAKLNLAEDIMFDEKGMPYSNALISLLDPTHVSFLLSYYSLLKQESYDDFQSDMYYLLLDLEDLVVKVFQKDHPILWDLLIWKIDGCTNEEIQKRMEATYGIVHSKPYFSDLWRKKIPKMISEQAKKDYLIWYYTNEEYGQWKRCGKCGEVKLAHPMFFSKNNSSKDGLYSICKDCRKKKADV